jgi:hypothetical protein
VVREQEIEEVADGLRGEVDRRGLLGDQLEARRRARVDGAIGVA